MQDNHLWKRAEALEIRVGPEITGGFDVGFDEGIPEETKDFLMHFLYWVEDRFSMPVTLWIDMKYKHYLLDPQGKRVRCRFYWAEFQNYPVFENPDDIPVIELPVRVERASREEILRALIEGISRYYTWLFNHISRDWTPDPAETEAVLQAYLQDKMA